MKLILKPNKDDIFVGSFLVLLIVSLIIALFAVQNSDDHYVYVKYDSNIVHQMDLHQDEVFIMHYGDEKYPDLLGDFEVTVKDGKVSITQNTCPQSYCKHIGPISHKGQSLVCAPNRIVIEIGKQIEDECDWGGCIDEN